MKRFDDSGTVHTCDGCGRAITMEMMTTEEVGRVADAMLCPVCRSQSDKLEIPEYAKVQALQADAAYIPPDPEDDEEYDHTRILTHRSETIDVTSKLIYLAEMIQSMLEDDRVDDAKSAIDSFLNEFTHNEQMPRLLGDVLRLATMPDAVHLINHTITPQRHLNANA